MVRKILNRPVLATLISIVFIVLGIVGISQLSITRFPDIAPPSVSVSTSFPGANAETVAEAVLLPLEEAINGVDNMTYISSTATNSGAGRISVFFELGTDPDQAAVNVQNRISSAVGQIPSEVNESGISVTKRMSGNIMTIDIYSEDPDGVFDETFLQAYSKNNILRELLRVPGVASISRIGAVDYSMRVWLNPEKMAIYGLMPQDITKAIKDQNFEVAPGKFGEDADEVFEVSLKYKGRFSLPEEFGSLVIRTQKDGSLLYLKDVARVAFEASNNWTENRVDGYPGITLNVTQTNESNAKEIDEQIRVILDRVSKDFPDHVKYRISYSVREQIDASIAQIITTLLEAFLLVSVIVFLFLQDIRTTIIPALAIPVSLVGTFFFLYLMGFSINILTMFALVLSIGIVVDDAIVVVEAVVQKMEETGMKAKPATNLVMSEITGAILSITFVMAAVFFPVGFMEGPVGLFYQQFAFTLAVAILISAVNALTLSPVLCAMFLKTKVKDEEKKPKFKDRLFNSFNAGFNAFHNKYLRVIKPLIKFKWLSLMGLAIVAVGAYFFMQNTPKAFIPTEDDSFLTYSITMPPGASLVRTKEMLEKAQSKLIDFEAIESMTSVSGYNVINASTSTTYAMGYINLKPYKERGKMRNIDDIMDAMRNSLSDLKGAEFSVFTRPTIQGFGDFSGLELVLQDRLGRDFTSFGETANDFIEELNKTPEISSAFTLFNPRFPQYELEVDYVKANSLGVNVKEMMTAVKSFYGRVQASDFSRFGRQYRVYMQADAEYKNDAESFNSIFIRNNKGEMLPANTLISLKKVRGPEIVNRYNLYNSISINAAPAAGYSSGDAMAAVERVAEKYLPAGYSFEWTGISLEEQKSGSQTTLIFALSLLFVYFLLSAQYESYIIPLSVLLSLPTGLFGVFLAVNIVGLQNNIYVQVGIIMLVGLLAKNAILIVEYAMQEKAKGLTTVQAAIKASSLRLRPIVMTSLAFVFGLIPLMWTVGPSAKANLSISVGAAGGMLAGVGLGIFIIPVLYVVFQNLHDKLSSRFAMEDDA